MTTRRLQAAVSLAAIGAAFPGVLSACGDPSEGSSTEISFGGTAGRGGGAGTRGSVGRAGTGGSAASSGSAGTSSGGAAASSGSAGTSTGGAAASGGKAGTSSGGAAASGGKAGASGGAVGQDAATEGGGGCPASAPADNSDCNSRGQACQYGQVRCVCEGGGTPEWNCSSGGGGGSSGDGGSCPPDEPNDNSPCSSPDLECDYGQNQCGCYGGAWRC
jgi:hypothetical protein